MNFGYKRGVKGYKGMRRGECILLNPSKVLPQTNCNLPMPEVNNPFRNDKVCNTCMKEDVCCYKEECGKAADDIHKIEERKNVFIKTDIRCMKWFGKSIVVARGL